MSEILHQPVGEFETYPEIKVPDIPETEIHKIPDIESFEREGYVADEELSRIMRMAHSEIEKMLSNGGRLSHEKVQKAEDKFLERINKPNSNEELLAKVFFGIALVNIKAAELEKGANHKERNEFLKENIKQKHWIGNFVYENQNNPKIIEEFWKEYELTYNELPALRKERKYEDDRNRKNKHYSKEDNLRIDKSGILGEVAAMNLFNEISKEGKTEIEIEQASTEEDMKGIDFIVRFKNKYDELKIIIVQVKCVTKDQSDDENTVKFYSRSNLKAQDDKARKLKGVCFDYEKEQRNSGNKNIIISGGLWIEFTKVGKLPMIDNRGRIVDKEKEIDEKRENFIKDQLKLQLELN